MFRTKTYFSIIVAVLARILWLGMIAVMAVTIGLYLIAEKIGSPLSNNGIVWTASITLTVVIIYAVYEGIQAGLEVKVDLPKIENGNIEYGEKLYPIVGIQHIFYGTLKTTQRLNFVKVGEPVSAALVITFNNGEEIYLEIDEGTVIIGWTESKKEALKYLEKLYFFLAKNTFEQRYKYYQNQIDVFGYFSYEGFQFFPFNKIVYKNRDYSLTDLVFHKSPGSIVLQEKNLGIIPLIRTKLFGSLHFTTLTDTDVFFTLIKNHFGLQWDS